MCGKYLKAILVSQEIEFPKTHDLPILNTLCTDRGVFTGFTEEDLGRLSGNTVHTRYPGNLPTPEEAKDALEIAKTLRLIPGMEKLLFGHGTIPASFTPVDSRTSPRGVMVATLKRAGEMRTGSFQ